MCLADFGRRPRIKGGTCLSATPLYAKNMIKIIICVILVFNSQFIIAQSNVILSPGVKLGYAFGENGGFTYGFEATIVFDHDNTIMNTHYGFVFSYEKVKNEERIHTGVQLNIGEICPLFEMEFGPTFILGENNSRIGLSFTPYFGAFIIPYLRITLFPEKSTEHEIGTFLKLHLALRSGYDLSFG